MKRSAIDILIKKLEDSNLIEYFAKNANDDSVTISFVKNLVDKIIKIYIRENN